jgi:EAL domain-containing protein (putative c-di-GMP-specific phosphodiesterase class I)
MVRAIIGLARELDIEVMAQGVENEAQRDLLTAAPSTTKVQGFYYSAPVPASGATQLLRQRLIEPRFLLATASMDSEKRSADLADTLPK